MQCLDVWIALYCNIEGCGSIWETVSCFPGGLFLLMIMKNDQIQWNCEKWQFQGPLNFFSQIVAYGVDVPIRKHFSVPKAKDLAVKLLVQKKYFSCWHINTISMYATIGKKKGLWNCLFFPQFHWLWYYFSFFHVHKMKKYTLEAWNCFPDASLLQYKAIHTSRHCISIFSLL